MAKNKTLNPDGTSPAKATRRAKKSGSPSPEPAMPQTLGDADAPDSAAVNGQEEAAPTVNDDTASSEHVVPVGTSKACPVCGAHHQSVQAYLARYARKPYSYTDAASLAWLKEHAAALGIDFTPAATVAQ